MWKDSHFQTAPAVIPIIDDFTVVPLKIDVAFLPFLSVFIVTALLQSLYFHRWVIWDNFQGEFVVYKLKFIIERTNKGFRKS